MVLLQCNGSVSFSTDLQLKNITYNTTVLYVTQNFSWFLRCLFKKVKQSTLSILNRKVMLIDKRTPHKQSCLELRENSGNFQETGKQKNIGNVMPYLSLRELQVPSFCRCVMQFNACHTPLLTLSGAFQVFSTKISLAREL